MGIGEKTPLLATSRSQRRIGRRPTTTMMEEKEEIHHYTNTIPPTTREMACHCGTHEGVGIWWSNDLSGTFLAVSVWISIIVVSGNLLSQTLHLYLGAGLCTTTCLALASHAKTAMTDPGTVPRRAIVLRNTKAAYCALCQVEKPPLAHHCRTCRRCICRMDHHCPWVKNCVGASNMKHFVLFLGYTWITCILALIESVYLEYFVGLVVSLFGLTFVTYVASHTFLSLRSGLGAIDRLQGKEQQQQRALRLVDIFGSNYLMWWFPVDPHFRDPEKVMGYAMNGERSSPNRMYQTGRWEFPTEVVDI